MILVQKNIQQSLPSTPQSKLLTLLQQKQLILEDISGQNKEIEMSAEQIEEKYLLHISMMHDYNDIKDITQSFLGRLAEIKQCTVTSLYKDYDLHVTD